LRSIDFFCGGSEQPAGGEDTEGQQRGASGRKYAGWYDEERRGAIARAEAAARGATALGDNEPLAVVFGHMRERQRLDLANVLTAVADSIGSRAHTSRLRDTGDGAPAAQIVAP
jgi:hypothetical protein